VGQDGKLDKQKVRISMHSLVQREQTLGSQLWAPLLAGGLSAPLPNTRAPLKSPKVHSFCRKVKVNDVDKAVLSLKHQKIQLEAERVRVRAGYMS
jgi:hypothetical protein